MARKNNKQTPNKEERRKQLLTSLNEAKAQQDELTQKVQSIVSEIALLNCPFEVGDTVEIPEGGSKGRYLIEGIGATDGYEWQAMGRFYTKAGELGKWTKKITAADNAQPSEAPEKVQKPTKAEGATDADNIQVPNEEAIPEATIAD